jgi:hypothetical protein
MVPFAVGEVRDASCSNLVIACLNDVFGGINFGVMDG